MYPTPLSVLATLRFGKFLPISIQLLRGRPVFEDSLKASKLSTNLSMNESAIAHGATIYAQKIASDCMAATGRVMCSACMNASWQLIHLRF
jgi:hypothetical protein